jgi:hypothetical protein
MPKRPSQNVVGKYIELDPEVVRQMAELAERNKRSFREEVEHALRRHLAAPPVVTVQVTVPELPPATIEVQEKPHTPKRGGRRRKGPDSSPEQGS